MTELLLITDVPRLRKIFSRVAEESNIRLRIANNLEKGGEEILAEKPAMVFVQTHLSGLSADILLMHLKKQLGRKRTRFVLLSPPDQVSDEIHKLYQGQIDTASEDKALHNAILAMVGSLSAKTKKVAPSSDSPSIQETQVSTVSPGIESAASASLPCLNDEDKLLLPEFTADSDHNPVPPEPSLEEQGLTYAARPKMSVYSEFTSSFNNAVSSMPAPEPLERADSIPSNTSQDWEPEQFIIPEQTPSRPKSSSFLIWLAPVLIAVVVVTVLQTKRKPKEPVSVDVSAKNITMQAPNAGAPLSKLPVKEENPGNLKPAPANTKPVAPPAVTGADMQLSDKAVLSAIAENQGKKDSAQSASRLTTVPEFIPRAGFDKGYSVANPGWERYKGRVTEFRIFRQNSAIRAIQTIDRGGQGVPEDFMKTVLRQVTKKPAFVMESSEKKDGYDIQRGKVAENIKVVYYRDQKGGALRAFVLTWKD